MSSLGSRLRRSKLIGLFLLFFVGLVVVLLLQAACELEHSGDGCSNFKVNRSCFSSNCTCRSMFIVAHTLTAEVFSPSSTQMAEYLMRSIILLFTIVSINFHITQARQWLSDILPPIVASTAINYSKLSDYEVFRWGFLAYLVVPTLLVVMQATILPSWEYEWCVELLNHLAILIIFVPVGSCLAPHGTSAISRPFRHQAASS
jgi:hypothetical protein